ncbi:cation channel sperm-associated auxiliary subunit delta isoform X11 [Rattus norvegicus]|uniref:cation channel sperm-associated auxiliary subunit delta isoform X11 n=1 Tax=Rattus norvegicus TaxID=10116 RepID=UPI002FD80206
MPFSSVVGINLDTVLPSTALKLVSGYGTGALDVRKSKFLVQPATCATINPNMAQHLCHGHLRLAECMGSVLCMVPWFRTVRTGKVFANPVTLEGDLLFYAFSNTVVVKNVCKTDIAVYLGQRVFITKNRFEASILPLTIPKSMEVKMPSITSAHFVSDAMILFVIDGKVYSYNFIEDIWRTVNGITEPVSHISGDPCCFEGYFCLELSNNLFAYFRGGQMPGTNIYFSNNGGFSFELLNSDRMSHLKGLLGGIFHFHSLSQVGILLVENNLGTFHYLEYPLNHSTGVPFLYESPLEVIIKPQQRGFLILWNQKTLLVSSNSGQIVEAMQLMEEGNINDLNVEHAKLTIHSIASNTYELAFLVEQDQLYYGSQSYMGNYIIKLSNQQFWSEEASVHFWDVGMLEVLTPVSDPYFPAFDFKKCLVNVQLALMDQSLQLEPCNVEFLESTMEDRMFIIDMNSKLKLSALMVPRKGMNPTPLVMVSNPHALGFKANLTQFGNMYDGNSKFKLDIELQQQQHWGNSELNFTASIKHEAISSITVDIADKTLSCVDLKPLSTLISVGCDLTKKVIVQKWKDGTLEEIMNAEYVILELNGIVTYSYSLTAATAHCRSQPQNWSIFKEDAEKPSLWNRETYVSCHEDNQDNPLLWPNVEYQILGGRTDNKIIFGQRNGIYTFYLTVVDPYYRGRLWSCLPVETLPALPTPASCSPDTWHFLPSLKTPSPR